MSIEAEPGIVDMYFSVDVETNGPVPGPHSMLSIGVVALDPATLKTVDRFYETLHPLPGSTGDPDTMAWWSKWPLLYAAATRDAKPPGPTMERLGEWVTKTTTHREKVLGHRLKPVFVAYPATFDFAFYAYYAHLFTKESVFGFSALDMGSLAMGMRGGEYNQQSRTKWPEHWVAPANRVGIHHALKDAEQQAEIFREMMRDRSKPIGDI